jgi:hypothetical protein
VGDRTVSVDHSLVAMTGCGLEKFFPAEPQALWPQADGKLVDQGQQLSCNTVLLLGDRASQGGMLIGYLQNILLAAGAHDPRHDEWNQAVADSRTYD